MPSLIGGLDIDKAFHGRRTEFYGTHVGVGVDDEVVDVVAAGLPFFKCTCGEGEFEQAVAKRASFHYVFGRSVFIGP